MSDLEKNISDYWDHYRAYKLHRDEAMRLKDLILDEMESNGQKATPHDDLDVRLKLGKPRAIDDMLRPLLETKYGKELIDSGAYTPPEPTMTKAKWNFAKLNSFKDYGKDIRGIIEQGTIRERPTLEIKEKK